MNFLEYDRINAQGKKQHFAWITDLPLIGIDARNGDARGRACWRIENETFNTLKNQGYEVGHNGGYGHQNLCSNLGLLMLWRF
ncbi:MAG: hypothetical protein I8H75_02705 [Myxococcaceae bacterium]|nr:hypothetical protein [Myxococcaceae bacterium]